MKRKISNFTEDEQKFLLIYKENLEHKISKEYNDVTNNYHLVHLFYVDKSYVHELEVKQDIVKFLKNCKLIIRKLKSEEKKKIEKSNNLGNDLKYEMKKILNNSFSQKYAEIDKLIDFYVLRIDILKIIMELEDKTLFPKVDFKFVKDEFKIMVKEGGWFLL